MLYTKDMKVQLVCENCERIIFRYPSLIKGKNQFCSPKCHNLFKTKCIYECEVCNEIFHRPIRLNQKRPRFCSRMCMWNKLRIERNPLNCKCGVCNKRFHKSPSAIRGGEGKFCSLKCRDTNMIGKGKHGIGIAQYPHYYNQPSWKLTREKVLERDHYFCQDCRIKPKHNSQLQVHHLKRRIMGGTDDLDNLITLCFSCHKKRDGRLY